MYCTRCGKEVQDGDRFCPNCGERIIRIEDAASVSKEHIPLDWNTSDYMKEKPEVKKATFDWGNETFGAEKRETPNHLMFQDRELVERATAELDLGDVRRRAQGLREDYEKIKETEEPHTELQGFSNAVEDMNNREFKSIKDIEDELFNSYVEKEEVIEEKNNEDEYATQDDVIEKNDDMSKESDDIVINDEAPSVDEIVENDIEDEHDDIADEPSETSSEEEIDFRKDYSNEERANIDDYLEKTIIYNRGDIEKRIEEDRLRLEEEKRREEAERNDMFIQASLDEKLTPEIEVKEEIKQEELKEEPIVEIEKSEASVVASIDEEPTAQIEAKEEIIEEKPIEIEKADEKFETFIEKSEAFDALLSKGKEKLEEKENLTDDTISRIESIFEEKYPDKKKKHGLFHKNDDYTQSVEVLAAIAQTLHENENKDSYVTWEDNTVKEEPKEEEKPKVSRMTITGLNLDDTYDFNNNRELGKVPKDVINEELDGSKVDELKEVIDDYYSEKGEEKVKKHTFAKVLIGILIFLIVVEITIVALKFFAPDSGVVATIDSVTGKIVDFVKNILNRG